MEGDKAMFNLSKDWNPKQARLKEIIKKKERFNEAMDVCLELHKIVHFSDGLDVRRKTFADEVFQGLNEEDLCIMPTEKDVTIGWNIWHITRIEDITINVLVQNIKQVLDESWLEKLNVSVKDTGNAMTDDEIIDFSNRLNKQELKHYRNAVAHQTRSILRSLSVSDMKRKVGSESVKRVLAEGGVLEHPDSLWLLDFWGKKDVAGILLMPITRHQIVHLNDCMKLKEKIRKKERIS